LEVDAGPRLHLLIQSYILEIIQADWSAMILKIKNKSAVLRVRSVEIGYSLGIFIKMR